MSIPSSLVSPTVLKAGAAFVSPSKLGSAIGSGSSQGVAKTFDEETGLTVELSLNNLIQQTNSLTSQSWYQRLTEFLQNFSDGTSDQELIDSWNNAVDEEGVFFDILGIYNKTSLDILGPSVTENNFRTTLQILPEWLKDTLVGTSSVSTNSINSITGNTQRFSVAMAICESYARQNNQFIDSVDSLKSAQITFTNMNNWITSGVTGVTIATRDFGIDLENTGRLLDFSEISQFGNPGYLIARLSQTSALPIIVDRLREKNIDVTTLVDRQGLSPPTLLKAVYDTFTEISGSELENIKRVLRIKTKNIQTVADLLDPRKIFPNSFFTLKSPIFGSTVNFKFIYSDESGGLSQEFSGLGGTLRSVMPSEIAAANTALSRSLGQITNIFSVSVEDFAAVLKELETLRNAEFIQNQNELVEKDVEDVWLDADEPIELGTGPRGRLLLADLIGLVAGFNSVAPIQKNIELFSQLESLGAFDPFTRKGNPNDSNIGFFQVIEHMLDGEYTTTTSDPDGIITSFTITIPSGVKGEGEYTAGTLTAARRLAWFDGIYPELISAAKQIVTDNTELATEVINNTIRWQIHQSREKINRSRLLESDFFELSHSREDSLRFAQQLPQRALDTSAGGSAQILEGVTDRSTQAGQSLIAAMREGRNIDRLGSVGISTQSIRPVPDGEKIEFSPSQFSANEARNL